VIAAAHPTREKGDGRDGEGGDGEEAGASEAGTAEDPQEPAGTHRDDLPVRPLHTPSLNDFGDMFSCQFFMKYMYLGP
jgi:hypothetical protein